MSQFSIAVVDTRLTIGRLQLMIICPDTVQSYGGTVWRYLWLILKLLLYGCCSTPTNTLSKFRHLSVTHTYNHRGTSTPSLHLPPHTPSMFFTYSSWFSSFSCSQYWSSMSGHKIVVGQMSLSCTWQFTCETRWKSAGVIQGSRWVWVQSDEGDTTMTGFGSCGFGPFY